MGLNELQQHTRTPATLELSDALVIRCHLNAQAGLPGFRNAFRERAMTRRSRTEQNRRTGRLSEALS